MTDRRKFMQGALAFPVVAAGQWSVRAEEPWPARTITIVVPFPPGGVADYAARPGNCRVGPGSFTPSRSQIRT